MQRRIVPDVIDGRQQLVFLPGGASLREAARTMTDRKVGAAMIAEDGRLVGIVTERDITRGVATGKDFETTTVHAIMTRNPVTIAPGDGAMSALARMQEGGFRHLPVVEDGRVVGMVSVRDLFAAVRRELEDELRSCEAFVTGETYGVAH